MKRTLRCAVFLLSALLMRAAWAGGSDDGMKFTDLRMINKSELALRVAFSRRVQIAQDLALNPQLLRQGTSIAFSPPLARVAIDAAALVLEVNDPRLSGDQKLVSLTIEGSRYDFALVDSTFDHQYGVYHIAGILISTVDGHARFTVRPSDGLVFGSLYAGDRSWRLIPADGGGGHVLHSIRPSTSAVRNDSALALGTGPLSDLEARHVQMLRVAEASPKRFHTVRDGSLVAISGAAIERVNLEGVLRAAADQRVEIDQLVLAVQLQAALERLRPLTRQPAAAIAIQSAVIRSTSGPGDLLVRVNEIIDGIPVEPAGLIAINTTTGAIEDFAVDLTGVRATDIDRTRWMDAALGASYAQNALLSRGLNASLRVIESRLQFARATGSDVVPQWLLQFERALPYVAIVDAITGETELVSTSDAQTQAICDSNGQPVTACASVPNGSPGTWRVSDRWSPRFGEGVPYPTSGVPQRHMDVFNTVEQFESFRASAGPPSYPQGGRMDVAVDVPGVPGPGYTNSTQTIQLPPSGQGGYLPGVDPTSPAAKQVIFHEGMHHAQNIYGGPSASVANQWPIVRAVKEGLADAGAALATGGDWTVFDGIMTESRDLSQPRSIGELDTLSGPHQQGMVIGNIIYRVSSKSNVSEQAIRNMAFETYARLDPSRAGDPARFDVADIYEAMRAAAGTNPYLDLAIEEVWHEMSGPPTNDPGEGGSGPSAPPGPGVPTAPSYVDGAFLYCAGGLSFHNVFWMRISGATHYEIYYQLLVGPYYYTASTSSTSVLMSTGTPAFIKIKACNASTCSWLSNDRYFMDDICFE